MKAYDRWSKNACSCMGIANVYSDEKDMLSDLGANVVAGLSSYTRQRSRVVSLQTDCIELGTWISFELGALFCLARSRDWRCKDCKAEVVVDKRWMGRGFAGRIEGSGTKKDAFAARTM